MTNQIHTKPITQTWALLRPDGSQRATTEAPNRSAAAKKLRAIIRKGTIPSDWKVVARATPASPTPRPFQVGDRVRRKRGIPGTINPGTDGTITSVGVSGAVQVHWEGFSDPLNALQNYDARRRNVYLELVEPAPQAKAEGRDFSQELRDKDQEIATLKAEVERLGGELADAGERIANLTHTQESTAHREKWEQRRAASAEAKLADISAIRRTMALAKTTTTEDWDFTTLLADVLDREA